MNTYISELVGAGADAMTNMYEVNFTLPESSALGIDAGSTQSLRIRTDGFTPPADSQATYAVHWKTVSVDRPSTKIVMDRQFAITFRVDAEWDLYKLLLKWKGITSVGSVGFASQLLTEALGTVAVKALGVPIGRPDQVAAAIDDVPTIADDSRLLWEYHNVWIETITNPDFSTESTEPAKVTATFRFGDFRDEASKYVEANLL
jgi:hypothetical protein